MIEIQGDLSKAEKASLRKRTKEFVLALMRQDGLKFVVAREEGIRDKHIFLKVRKFSRKEVMIGINSNSFTDNPNKHILMLDFDLSRKVKLSDVRSGLVALQGVMGLPKIKLYRSSKNGLFALCFTPLSFDEMLECVGMMKLQCEGHKFCILKNGFATLRLTPKPDKPSTINQLEEILPEKGTEREYLRGAEQIFEELIL